MIKLLLVASAAFFMGVANFAPACSMHTVCNTELYFQAKSDGTTVSADEKLGVIVSNLSILLNENGKPVLPKDAVVDRAEIIDDFITLWITLPEGFDHEKDAVVLGGQISGILRYHFADLDHLRGSVINARDGVGMEYGPLGKPTLEEKMIRNPADDYFEPNGPGPSPDPDYEKWYAELRADQEKESQKYAGQAQPAGSGMPTGALAGKIIFTYGGHGRTWDGDATNPYWRWQRPILNGMMEDFGNVDASDAYAYYCFNAGATVVSFRPIGYQNNEVIIDNPSATFTGSWSNSVNSRFYGSGVNYRFATTNVNETATATYTPNIPSAGYYPVYTWANYGSDRTPGQLYKIRTTGGESQVRVDHRRVGCGWIYLGTYWFNAGSNPATGSVVISNMKPPGDTGSNIAVADAIRFGNGMGDVNKGGGISGYSRREESTLYWIQNGWGNGNMVYTVDNPNPPAANLVWNNGNSADDETWSWSAPPEMARQMYRVHSDTSVADKRYALYLGWHSNAAGSTTARGSVGLITGSPTTNQAWYAAKVSDELDAASLEEDAAWEYTWFNRASSTYSGAYGEITNGNFGSEMDATIIEVGYHTSPVDAALMRDPKVRNVHGRGAYRAAVQYFNTFRQGLLAYSPETPQRFSARNNGSGAIDFKWQPGPTGGTKGHLATSYRLYQSPDGLGWNSGTVINGTQHTLTGLTPGQKYYFRVAGLNNGGESFPTEVLAVRVKNTGSAKVLIVNAYDRIDRFNNIPRPGLSPAVDQLIHYRNNYYNYVRQHADAVGSAGLTFDSCDNESIISNDVNLLNYETVVWISGEESSADDTFNATERNRVTAFLNSGSKNLFVSGAEIGYELAGQSVDAGFYTNYLAAGYGGDDGGSYVASGVAGTILAGISMNFAPGPFSYDADYPDRLNPVGGSIVAANYTGGGSGGAAVQFSGGSPARKVVNLGFPFELISSETARNQVMAAAMTYFGTSDSSLTAAGDWQLFE